MTEYIRKAEGLKEIEVARHPFSKWTGDIASRRENNRIIPMSKHSYFANLATKVHFQPLWVDVVTYLEEKKNGRAWKDLSCPHFGGNGTVCKKISWSKRILRMSKLPCSSFRDTRLEQIRETQSNAAVGESSQRSSNSSWSGFRTCVCVHVCVWVCMYVHFPTCPVSLEGKCRGQPQMAAPSGYNILLLSLTPPSLHTYTSGF